MCRYIRKKRRYHPCVLVGPVVRGGPVAAFNRRVLHLRLATKSVESGTFGAVKEGGGRITQVRSLGRVTVRFDEHLQVVDEWLEEIMQENFDAPFETIVLELEARIRTNPSPPMGVKTMQLDIFSAWIVNRMEDSVFVYRTPSSFP